MWLKIKVSLTLVLLSLWLGAALAVENQYQFDDPQQQQLFLQLTQELRCPKCQNQNIADSNASIAVDLKNKVYQLVNQGHDKTYIVDYMKQRYGNFVHYQPPVNAVTLWLWLLPLLFVVFAGWRIWRSGQSVPEAADADALKAADKILEDCE